MKLYSSLLILLFQLSSLFAQEDNCIHSVEGEILDIETKQAIPYVTVRIKGTERHTTTDIDGKFLFENLCTETNTLIISCFGYCETVCEHNHQHGKSPHIYLTQEVMGLETVLIEAENKKEEGTASIAQINLNKAELQLNPTQSMAAALSGEQGITFVSSGSNAQMPVIHGLYGNRILVLNNGMKHGFQNWGIDHAPEIDISAAHSITVIKGAAGVRFGPEAIGGAININPNPLHLNKTTYAKIGTSYQSNGKGYNAGFETGTGFEKWSYFINGNYTKIGDRHAPDYMLTNSGKEEKSFGLGTRYHLKDFDFKLYYSYIDQNLAFLRSSIAESGDAFVKAINSDRPLFIRPFSYDINEPNQLTTHHLAKAEINWYYADDAKLTLIAGKQLNLREEYDVRRNADKPIINLDLTTSDYQLEWKHPEWLQLDGFIGFQIFNQDNDNNPGTGTTPFIPNYNTNRFSSFIIESKRSGKNTFEIGLRFDHETSDIRGRESNNDVFKDNYSFSNLSTSVGFIRKINHHSTFRTNIGTAWRSPNMAELYSFGQHGFKNSFGLLRYYTNEDGDLKTDKVIAMKDSKVKPEKGYKFVNEFSTHNNNNSHHITLYGHYIENFIYDRPYGVYGTIRGPMPAYIYVQSDAVFLGADYSWKHELTQRLSGTFGLSYLWSKNISENEPLINQPPTSISYQLAWKKAKLGVLENSVVALKPSYTFTQYQAPRTVPPEDLIDGSEIITPESPIFDFKDAPDGYFLLDLSWNFQWKDVQAGFIIKNITNTAYRDYLNEMRLFADEPGRNFLLTLNYTIN